MMLKAGITGGIGSGKSTICKIFSLLDIPVYSADERAKFLMDNNSGIRNAFVSEFGEDIYIQEKLNKTKLADIIFNNKEALNFVNSIVHPAVGIDYLEWTNKITDSVYCIKEAALLFESGLYRELDCLITVICPEELRIKRVMQRDNVSYEKVSERIRNQWNDEEKMKLSDYVIYNDDKNSLIEQILNIHVQLLKRK